MRRLRSNNGDIRRHFGMTSADSLLSSTAFATRGAGSGYFATAEHYKYLAQGVVAGLHRGRLALKTGVLVAHSSSPDRFDGPARHRLEEGLAAQLSVQHLDRDEVEAFIRYQLAPESGSNFLTPQRIALIGITSGGDPMVVNRLARRMFEQEPGAPTRSLP